MQFLKSRIGPRNPLRLLYHHARAFFAAARYGFPARKLVVIGVTGTDGKTTTVGMIAHILHQQGISVGAATTAFLQIQDIRTENETHLTSLSPNALHRFLRQLVRAGCTHAVIECSSHGLVQGRCSFTWPSVAAITNIAHEHLDYHGTMEQYIRDKGILFTMLKGKGTRVLNVFDQSFTYLNTIPAAQTITWSSAQDAVADYVLSDVISNPQSCTAVLHTGDATEYVMQLNIPGIFNLYNALCALLCAQAAGIDIHRGIHSLGTFQPIAGRLEQIDEGQPFYVFVDFAVSPQAYENVLRTLRDMVGDKNHILVLCSMCGNRMLEKGPEIGLICSALADTVVATEDETYGDDPMEILETVWSGIDQSKTDAHKIPDRREAIAFLLKKAQPGDAVAICGMGPFTTFTRLEGRIPWDEREVTREELRTLQNAAP